MLNFPQGASHKGHTIIQYTTIFQVYFVGIVESTHNAIGRFSLLLTTYVLSNYKKL